MNPGSKDDASRSGESQKNSPRFIPPVGPRSRKPYRELPLVKLAAWLVLAAFIVLVIFIIWALATHEPSRFPPDADPF